MNGFSNKKMKKIRRADFSKNEENSTRATVKRKELKRKVCTSHHHHHQRAKLEEKFFDARKEER